MESLHPETGETQASTGSEYAAVWQEAHDDVVSWPEPYRSFVSPDYTEQVRRAYEAVASWPDYMKRNIIVGASDGNSYLLSDLRDLIANGTLPNQHEKLLAILE